MKKGLLFFAQNPYRHPTEAAQGSPAPKSLFSLVLLDFFGVSRHFSLVFVVVTKHKILMKIDN